MTQQERERLPKILQFLDELNELALKDIAKTAAAGTKAQKWAFEKAFSAYSWNRLIRQSLNPEQGRTPFNSLTCDKFAHEVFSLCPRQETVDVMKIYGWQAARD